MIYVYILLVVLGLFCIRLFVIDKVRIKWKTFLKKGFKAKRGNFGLYTYTGNQGKGKTLSLTEYIFDNKKNSIFFLNIQNIKCLNIIDYEEYLKKGCDSRSISKLQSNEDINEKHFSEDSNKIKSVDNSIMDSSRLNFMNQTKILARRNLANNLESETTLNLSEDSRQLESDTDNATAHLSRSIGNSSSVGVSPSWYATFNKSKGVGNSHEQKHDSSNNDSLNFNYDLNDLVINNNYDDSKGLGIYYNGLKGLVEVKKALDNGLFDDLIKDKQIVFVFDELFTELTRNTTLSLGVQDFLCQLRKRKIIFLTTAQIWSELPLYLRRLCRYQINCDIINLPTFSILVKEFRDAENMKWDNDTQEHVAPTLETSVTKCRVEVANQYDTMERITNDETRKNENKKFL